MVVLFWKYTDLPNGQRNNLESVISFSPPCFGSGIIIRAHSYVVSFELWKSFILFKVLKIANKTFYNLLICIISSYFLTRWARDISVIIATCYGLYGLRIESLWRRDFPHLSRTPLGPTQPPVQWVSIFFPGGKAAGAWLWPSTPI